jgi:hypothetical protein
MDFGIANVAEKEWLVDYIIQFLRRPSWTEPIEEFISNKCVHFDLSDPEENKLEYTGLHNEFKQIVESLLVAHFLEVDIMPEEFAAVFDACCSVDARLEEVAAQLASVDDFLVFKKMMTARYKHRFGDNTSSISGNEPKVVEQAEELAAQQHTQEVLSLLYKRQSESAAALSAALADEKPEVHSACKVPEDDDIPPLPEMVTSATATTAARPSRASLPSIASGRIAAIVAGAARAKTNDKEKAALVNLAGNSKIAHLRGGGC